MATRQQLATTFGEVNLSTAPPHPKGDGVFPEEISEVIFHKGLPVEVPGVFALRLKDRPKAFNVLKASDARGDIDVLCIGAPNSETMLRYCVDIERGHVVLVDIEEGYAQLINDSLENFMEYLLRIGQFMNFQETASEQQKEPYFDLLSAYLHRVDSFAVQDSQSWWWRVLDRTRSR